MPLGGANSRVVGAGQKTQLKTMQPMVEVGQRFKFTVLLAIQAISALYANLAKPYFARIYAKLLIPRLGT
jgi:hypothetical protein